MARAHYAAQTQTVSHPSSSESARVAMPIIPPAPLAPEHETATFMFGGHRALMAIINDVSDYDVDIDSSNQIVVTSTPKILGEIYDLPFDFVKPARYASGPRKVPGLACVDNAWLVTQWSTT